MPVKKDTGPIEVKPIQREYITVNVLGTTPLLCNSMRNKVMQELIYPDRRRRNKMSGILKHNPLEEYRESVYLSNDATDPTAILLKATAFKGAMRGAAVEHAATSKAQIGRLVYLPSDWIYIYGVPQLWMEIVRTAGINGTPDVRTLAIIPQWCATIHISYVTPMLNSTAITNLLSSAGTVMGVGDGRPEKGKLNYGQFEIVNDDDPALVEIQKTGGRLSQLEALETPTFYSGQAEQLYTWFMREVLNRGDTLDTSNEIPALLELQKEQNGVAV